MPGAIARIEINAETCIGSDACVAVAPKTFRIDPETNVAVVIDPHGDPEEYFRIAAVDCPPERSRCTGTTVSESTRISRNPCPKTSPADRSPIGTGRVECHSSRRMSPFPLAPVGRCWTLSPSRAHAARLAWCPPPGMARHSNDPGHDNWTFRHLYVADE